jgi:uncharacterized membrane protein
METKKYTTGRGMAIMLIVTGSIHFINPNQFNQIVPPILPGDAVLWTYLSGAAELIVAFMLLAPISMRFAGWNLRLLGAWASLALFIAVYPANIYMAIDWSDRELSEQLIAYARLPLQFGLFYWSWALIKDIRKHLQVNPV